MKIPLFTRAPRQLPPFSYLVDEIPGAHRADALAAHLGVSVRTVRAWRAKDAAPRAAMLALFWDSKWGLGTLDAALHNEAQTWLTLAKGYEREIGTLKARIAYLEALNASGAANSPLWQMEPHRALFS
jgi:hypothetical protein